MANSPQTYLEIYLRDHHAGAVGGLELVGRMVDEESQGRGLHGDTEYATFLRRLRSEMQRDLEALEAEMRRFGASPSRVKDTLSWLAEKLGRLKLNGELTGRSPLGRVLELEALNGAIHAKQRLWKTLVSWSETAPALASTSYAALYEAAEQQAKDVEHWHEEAVRRLRSGQA